ncbi:glutathione transferase GstA [Duganella sp. FT109W]|uniref:Glutathione transferase GstA n=1 Tax=Duganella margarita TaxID=2692170 RepID=A0ABW9WJK9_9BURK|nr:glutathione transferase GstA [Duganella margarita]MYN41246.1 glutathione transferase GstA [Duganella margarita]
MKLYYAPHTCSLSPLIVLNELGLPHELIKVDNQSKRTADGRDFRTINPKGYVAALELENGEVLTEGPAIIQYLADLKPEAALAPPAGSWERVRLQEMLNFITSEIHAGVAPLFNSELPEAARTIFRDRLSRRMSVLETTLQQRAYLMGAIFSVADAYLYTVLGWFQFFAIDLNEWPAVASYHAGLASRPSIQAAQQAHN